MPTILLTNSYSDNVIKIVKPLIPDGFKFINLNETSKQELITKAPLADYFLDSGRLVIDKDVIDAAINLKMIQRTGIGIDGIDLEYIKKQNIPVYVNKGINAISVAEHTILLILATLRKITLSNNLTKQGIWKKNDHGLNTHSLFGKTIGLIGLGNIGLEVTKMLKPFQCNVIYFKNKPLSSIDEQEYGVTFVSFSELIEKSDIVSLHCSLNEKTRYLINESVLKKMKPDSFIINTARGGIIHEEALIKYLKLGHIKGAGLDVFEQEPVNENNELLKMENVLVSAHVSGITKETFQDMIKKAFNNIIAFHNGDENKIFKNKLVL